MSELRLVLQNLAGPIRIEKVRVRRCEKVRVEKVRVEKVNAGKHQTTRGKTVDGGWRGTFASVSVKMRLLPNLTQTYNYPPVCPRRRVSPR